jgi:dipeptidyl aminopeptidase/acylaminoacyl peptidase
MAMPKLKRNFGVQFLAIALVYACASAHAATEKFSAKAGTLVGGDTLVNGDLTIPEGGAGKRPAVVVIHSSGGYEDPTRAPYVAALNAAGIATLELNLFANGGRPPSTNLNLPHVYGALNNLSSDPRIDARQIGIMGFSHGGLLSMFSASEAVTREYTGGKTRFAVEFFKSTFNPQ